MTSVAPTCSAGATVVENHVSSIKNNVTVTASEPFANALHLKFNYPSNVNNSNYEAVTLMYNSNNPNTNIAQSGGYIIIHVSVFCDGPSILT